MQPTPWRVPFSTDGTDNPSDPPLPDVAQQLRSNPALWHALVPGAPTVHAGSFALELGIVLFADGNGSVLEAADARAASIIQGTRALQQEGMAPARAAALATEMTRSLTVQNAAVIRGIHRMGDQHAVQSLVMRVSIRPLRHLAGNAHSGATWFRSTHANVFIVTRTACFLLEPVAPSVLPAVHDAVCRALPPNAPIVYDSAADAWAPVADLSLCTQTAAVLALCVLANLHAIHSRHTLQECVRWVRDNQHWFLRLLQRAITRAGTTSP